MRKNYYIQGFQFHPYRYYLYIYYNSMLPLSITPLLEVVFTIATLNPMVFNKESHYFDQLFWLCLNKLQINENFHTTIWSYMLGIVVPYLVFLECISYSMCFQMMIIEARILKPQEHKALLQVTNVQLTPFCLPYYHTLVKWDELQLPKVVASNGTLVLEISKVEWVG